MERNKSGFLALIGLVAVASLFTVCKASGAGSGSDPEEEGGKSARSVNAISKFSVTSPVEAVGVIDDTEHTIAVYVPSGTDVTGMTVSFEHSGASAEPVSGTEGINFTEPQPFTVTAVDGSKQPYTVTVNVGSPDDKEIVSFRITAPVEADGEIDAETHSIAVNVPYGTELDSMTVLIGHTGASVNPASGTTDNGFTEPRTFTVTAKDGSTQDYTVTVTQPSPRTLVLYPLGGTWKPELGFSDPQTWTLAPGEGITLPAEPDMITNDGNFLVSWNTSDDPGGTDYTQGQYYVPTGDTVLYARWAEGDTWVDKAGAQAAINAAEAAIAAAAGAGGGGTVIMVGNPAQGTAPQSVLNQIDYLMGLLDGHPVDVEINSGSDGAMTLTITLYNVGAIEQATTALTDMVSGGLITGAVIVPKWTFVYTGDIQEVKLATTGTYEIELEGASGGHIWSSSGNTTTGGKGGHVLGRYHFGGSVQSPVHLDVLVGGQGAGTATYQNGVFAQISSGTMTAKAGGYNGGGGGGSSYFNGDAYKSAGAGGGGATDVRLNGNAALTGLADDPRIIVAGGGGGSAEMTGGSAGLVLAAGNAGGLVGAPGGNGTAFSQTYPGIQGGTQSDGYATVGTGQTGINGDSYFGYAWEGGGGGGAGWWGGRANTAPNAATSGAGGSSYTGGTTAYPVGGGATPVLTTPYDPSSPAYVPGSAANNATIDGNVYGNGKATIRWISPGN